MSPQPSKNRSSLPAAGLAACVLGAVLFPLIFVALFGGVDILLRRSGGLPPEFWLATLPPLLIGIGYLLYRFLRKPRERASGDTRLSAKIARWLMVVLSWFVIAVFVVIISKYPLNATFEQVGISLTFFLLASLLSLPVVLIRKTALQQRLMQLPNSIVTAALALVVSVSTVIAVVYLMTPATFIGDHKGSSAPSYLALGSLIHSDSSNIALSVMKYIDYLQVVNSSQDPITIKSILFNDKPDCYANKPTPLPIKLQSAGGVVFFSQCDVIDVTVETDQGSASFKFDLGKQGQ
jgi:hypothetical protein